MQRPAGRYDVIVVGGGHNGLVAAAYLARAGLKVTVLEARQMLGGPCGTHEFIPGYRAAFTNSPGSLAPSVVRELELESYGLRFVRTDPSLVHPFAGRCFVGWRDQSLVAAQLESFAPGEADRYAELFAELERLGKALGVSIFGSQRGLSEMAKRVPPDLEVLFGRVFFGSLQELLDVSLRSVEAKALLGMLGLNTIPQPPSAPGTAIGLMLRPLSIASSPPSSANDPRRVALRGSTGLPVGGMGAIIDALAACCSAHDATLRTGVPVERVLYRDGAVKGVVIEGGEEVEASIVISAINPQTFFGKLVDDGAVGADVRREIATVPMNGSAFKIVLALDGLPHFSGLPKSLDPAQVVGSQFRIGPSLAYIENAVLDGLRGIPSEQPIMWGLIPTVSSPELAPPGHHVLSINVWHAPYDLRDGEWSREQTQAFGRRCIEVLAEYMPDLPYRIVDHRFFSPVDIERDLGLVRSNITHGDMLPAALFGPRPHPAANDYRTPLSGLYLTGSGTWPGGYVTGVPGHNTSQTVISDLRRS